MSLLFLLGLSVLFIVVATARWKLHPFLALILAAFGFGVGAGMAPADVLKAINTGFGDTIGAIGIVILAGSIIGTFLEKSGGAHRLAESALRLTGRKNVPLAMAVIGYFVSMPVFCDSGFILLSPLNKALAAKARISLAAGAIALSLGLYATHTMVPPTPGPVAAAGVLGADLGRVILCGAVVSIAAVAAGWIFAVRVAARVHIDPLDAEAAPGAAGTPPRETPPLPLTLVPMLLPVLLLVTRSIAELPGRPFGDGSAAAVLGFLGQPVAALMIGVLFAFLLPRRFDRRMLSASGWVGQAVAGAAAIIVITGAGGAFGGVLRDSGIAEVLGAALEGRSGLGIWLPFAAAAAIKTAQGSSTVAIITTAGLTAPLLPSLGLEGETAKAMAVVAIGAGAMAVSHANDSYFWVVTQFSKMSVSQGYRLQTLGTLVEAGAAILTLWAISLFVL